MQLPNPVGYFDSAKAVRPYGLVGKVTIYIACERLVGQTYLWSSKSRARHHYCFKFGLKVRAILGYSFKQLKEGSDF